MNQKTEKKGIYQIIIDQITGIFLPVINLITAASILKSVIVLLGNFHILNPEGGIYQVFYAVGDGFFYFLPVFLALSAAKKWKTDEFTSLLIALTLLYPGIVQAVEEGEGLGFGPMHIPQTIYHSSVLPILMAIGLLCWVEKPLEKYLHESIKGFMKPILCCVVVLPITFMMFGPIGTWIGDVLTKLFFAIYEKNAVLAGAFMGFIMQPMVVVGAHWSVVPVSISNIMTNGYDVIMPLVGGAVYAQSGAAFAVALMYQDKERKRMAYQASLTAALGVTEPSLFGVNVPLTYPMICACVAGAIGGSVAGISGAHCNSFAFPSVMTSVAYAGDGFLLFMISMLMGFPLGFLFTMMFRKKIQKKMEKQ